LECDCPNASEIKFSIKPGTIIKKIDEINLLDENKYSVVFSSSNSRTETFLLEDEKGQPIEDIADDNNTVYFAYEDKTKFAILFDEAASYQEKCNYYLEKAQSHSIFLYFLAVDDTSKKILQVGMYKNDNSKKMNFLRSIPIPNQKIFDENNYPNIFKLTKRKQLPPISTSVQKTFTDQNIKLFLDTL